MITGALAWFFGGLYISFIFHYSSILLILGVVALFEGIKTKNLKIKKNRSFSETKPFERTAELKTKVWDPFWLFKTKGILSGILLLSVGIFYLIWALIREDLIISAVCIFWAPGIYITLLALKKKPNK